MTTFTDGSGSTSSSGGSCSSTSGMAAGLNSNPREAHVRLLLQPEVDQRRRQSARCLRLGTDTQCFFDERFKFPVSHDHLADKTLRFQVIISLSPLLIQVYSLYGPCVVGLVSNISAGMMYRVSSSIFIPWRAMLCHALGLVKNGVCKASPWDATIPSWAQHKQRLYRKVFWVAVRSLFSELLVERVWPHK